MPDTHEQKTHEQTKSRILNHAADVAATTSHTHTHTHTADLAATRAQTCKLAAALAATKLGSEHEHKNNEQTNIRTFKVAADLAAKKTYKRPNIT